MARLRAADTPRSSASGQSAVRPAPIAALPAPSPTVSTGPPLSCERSELRVAGQEARRTGRVAEAQIRARVGQRRRVDRAVPASVGRQQRVLHAQRCAKSEQPATGPGGADRLRPPRPGRHPNRRSRQASSRHPSGSSRGSTPPWIRPGRRHRSCRRRSSRRPCRHPDHPDAAAAATRPAVTADCRRTCRRHRPRRRHLRAERCSRRSSSS